MKVGFIGLGLMGGGMAAKILRAKKPDVSPCFLRQMTQNS